MQDAQPAFSVNTFFNQLPVRVVGTHHEPWFYGQDVADVLGIKRVTNSIKNFSNLEVVSDADRLAKGVVTYHLRNGNHVENNKVILLTEQGVYRLIISSRVPIANQFREFVYNLIKNARLAEETRLKTTYDMKIEEIKTYMDAKTKDLEKYMEILENNPPVTVCRKLINDDPYKHIPAKVVDQDIAVHGHDDVEYIYCITTLQKFPTGYTPWLCLYGDSEEIMDRFSGESLEIMPEYRKHTIYTIEFDRDIDIRMVEL